MVTTYAHLPIPFSLTGAGVTQVVRGLARAHLARGDRTLVVLSDNREVVVEHAESIYADFSQHCRREYFIGREYLMDHVAGALGAQRPYMSRFFAPAATALERRRSPPDVVIVHEGHFAVVALPRFRRAFPKARLLYYAHNQISRAVRGPELRRLLEGVDGVVAVSDYLANQVQSRFGKGGPEVHTVLNGVDLERFGPPDTGHVKSDGERVELIFVGQLAAHKGLHVLLAALAAMTPTEQRRMRLTVVGGALAGPEGTLTTYEASLRQAAQRLESPVVFEGWQPPGKVAAALKDADVALVPSVFPEPFGQVALEAMATGLPVVASDQGGLPEVVGSAGLVVSPTVESLVEALREVADPAARERLRSGSMSRARELGWESRIRLLDRVLG